MPELIIIKNDEPGKPWQNRTMPSILIGFYGEININKAANALLELREVPKFSFGCYPDDGGAYLAIDPVDGFPGTMTKTGSIRIKNKRAVQRLLDAMKCPPNKSLLMYFGATVTLPGLGRAWRLIKAI